MLLNEECGFRLCLYVVQGAEDQEKDRCKLPLLPRVGVTATSTMISSSSELPTQVCPFQRAPRLPPSVKVLLTLVLSPVPTFPRSRPNQPLPPYIFVVAFGKQLLNQNLK